jgi:endo-alpha-1,4-polygalactosaminidase (GH114 family)
VKHCLLALGLTLTASAAPWPPADYALFYGSFTSEIVKQCHDFDLVVVHPGDNFTNLNADYVNQIKAGKDGVPGTADDVWVIAYISIGEDEQAPAGPPKSPKEDGPILSGPMGLTLSRAGYPTRFLDESTYLFQASGERVYSEGGKPLTQPGHDGIPDENGVWGSYFVNPGDVEWQKNVLEKMMHLREVWKVDGFFLDTLDTASPWGSYAYLQPQLIGLLKNIREAHPKQKIIGNRGLFLLEKFSLDYRKSLDGVLYESLYTNWDWFENQGALSPWAAGDYQYLRDVVLPASRQNPGFQMFYVNYLNPQQADFYPLLHSIEDLLGRSGLSNYVADPLLKQLQRPISEVFPEKGSAPPQFGGLSIKELDSGRFELNYQAEENDGKLGQDLFLDVRLSKQSQSGAGIALLEPLPVRYSTPGRLEGLGLEKGTRYFIYARLVGKSRSQRSNYLEISLTTAQGPQPTQVQKLKAEGRESSIFLSWQDSGHRYRVYQGPTPWQLTPIGVTNKPQFVIKDQINGQSTFVSVSALDTDERESALCSPLRARAQDSTPPPSPTAVVAKSEGARIAVSWNSISDASSYKVYCCGSGEKYRVPLRVNFQTLEVDFGRLSKGRYDIWVTAVDSAGNESRRNQTIELEIK